MNTLRTRSSRCALAPYVVQKCSFEKLEIWGFEPRSLTGAIRALYQLSYIPAFFANYNPSA